MKYIFLISFLLLTGCTYRIDLVHTSDSANNNAEGNNASPTPRFYGKEHRQ